MKHRAMETVRQTLSSLNVPNSAAMSPSARQPLTRSRLHSSSKPGMVAAGTLRIQGLPKRRQTITPKPSSCHRIVMKESPARGYAGALAEAGQAGKNLEAIAEDITKFGSCLDDPQFYQFMVNPVMAAENKKKVIQDLGASAGFQPFTVNLLSLLVDRRRAELMREVVKEFEAIYNEMLEVEVATVTSAVKLETSQLALIAKKLQSLSGAKNVKIKNVIDPSVIAGFIVKFGKDGSRQVDMSVKRQLEVIASQIQVSEAVAA